MIDRVVSMVGDLRGHPALLAIVILQIITMAVIYMVASANAEYVAQREMALIESCKGDK
jgi:hypothetical protein